MRTFKEYFDAIYIAFSAVVLITVSFYAGKLSVLTECNLPDSDYAVIAGLFVLTGAPLIVGYIVMDYLINKILDK